MTFRRPWLGSPPTRIDVLCAATAAPLTVAISARAAPAADGRNVSRTSACRPGNDNRATAAPSARMNIVDLRNATGGFGGEQRRLGR
jgi:uncharacterized protein (DUF1501 family)